MKNVMRRALAQYGEYRWLQVETSALVTDMDAAGHMIGNSLEVEESLQVLRCRPRPI